MKIINTLSNHPVYNSLKKTLNYINEYEEKFIEPKKIRIKNTHHLEYLGIKDWNNIYVLKDPLINIDVWNPFRAKTIMFSEYFSRGKKDWIVKKIFRIFRKDIFVAPTKRTYKFLKENGNKVVFVPPAEKIRKRKKGEYLLYAGRLVKNKNTEMVVRIAKQLKYEKFLIIGDGPEKKKIKKISKGLKNIELVDKISRDKLFDIYAKAKIFLHPAIKDPIGFTIIEALTGGVPVLASNKAGASDYLPKQWVVEPNNLEEWITKINYILDNLTKENKKTKEIVKKEHLDIEENNYWKNKAKEIKSEL